MTAKELRKEARENLANKWGQAALMILAYIGISFLLGLAGAIPVIGSLIPVLFEVPLTYALFKNLMDFKRGKTDNVIDFVKNILPNFGRAWKVSLWTIFKMLLPAVIFGILLVIAIILVVCSLTMANDGLLIPLFVVGFALIVAYVWTICRSFLMVLTQYIAIDNEEMTEKDCVEKSMELMNGNRMKYFLLTLSFIGWGFLCCFTFGIGILFLIPYMSITGICFYEHLAGKKEEKVIENAEVVAENESPVVEND